MSSTSEHSSSDNQTRNRVVYICSITPLHPGIGRVEGVVDLPVQRDAYGLPTIYSSSLKGALRKVFERTSDLGSLPGACNGLETKVIFGDQDRMGAVNILDSQLLIFPARSLKGVVVGVTTPFLLRRHLLLAYNLGIEVGISISDLDTAEESKVKLITADRINPNCYLLKDETDENRRIVINELSFRADGVDNDDKLGAWIKKFLNNGNKSLLPYQAIAIVNDNWLRPLLRKSMDYRTRIRIDPSKKRPVTGGLWTVELIPQGTIFSTFIVPSSVGSNDFRKYMRCIESILDQGIFVGGDETVGAGLVKRISIG